MRVSTTRGDVLGDGVSTPRGVWLKIIDVPGERLPDSEDDRAIRMFDKPDFIHIGWDGWAKRKVVAGDVAVFAKDSLDDEPSPCSYPDLYE